jgi:hypothetical protein
MAAWFRQRGKRQPRGQVQISLARGEIKPSASTCASLQRSVHDRLLGECASLLGGRVLHTPKLGQPGPSRESKRVAQLKCIEPTAKARRLKREVKVAKRPRSLWDYDVNPNILTVIIISLRLLATYLISTMLTHARVKKSCGHWRLRHVFQTHPSHQTHLPR